MSAKEKPKSTDTQQEVDEATMQANWDATFGVSRPCEFCQPNDDGGCLCKCCGAFVKVTR